MADFCVDSSVLVAMFNQEPEADRYEFEVTKGNWIIGWPNVLETRIWLMRNQPDSADSLLKKMLADPSVTTVAFDGPLALLASDAFNRFGKGRHPAKLNYGDCMTYAVAKQADLPLLFKGEDFALTDITPHPASRGGAV